MSRVLRSVLPPAPAPAEADAIDPACDSDNEDHDVYDALDRRWEVKNDEPNIEIATPILRTHEDLSMLQRVVAALEKSGATCDNGTGVHVHVDADRIDAPALTYLLALVTRHEPYIFSALEVEHTRRNIYCRPLALAQVKHAVRAAPQSIDDLAAAFRVNPFMAKFVGVNFEPIFARGGFGTIEFRYFNGCLDPHAIGCYVGYVMALMHHTATEAASPAPDAHATLPGLLQTVGLAPNSPVSRLLCDRLRANLESLTRATPHLAELVRSQYYTGDAALLLSMGVPAESIERVLEKDLHPEAFLTHAVSFMRYIPMGTNAGAFKHFCAVPAEHRAELVTLAKSLLDTPRLRATRARYSCSSAVCRNRAAPSGYAAPSEHRCVCWCISRTQTRRLWRTLSRRWASETRSFPAPSRWDTRFSTCCATVPAQSRPKCKQSPIPTGCTSTIPTCAGG